MKTMFHPNKSSATRLWLMLLFLLNAIAAFAASSAVPTVKLGFFEFGGMFEGASPEARKSGYCYEYMMQIAVYTGWNYEFCYGSYAELYEKLKNGEIDILPYTNYNEERGRQVLFSDNILAMEEYYLAVKPDYARQQDGQAILPDGATISTIIGADYNSLLLDFIRKNNLQVKIVYFPNVNDAWEALRSGKVDATVLTSNAYSRDKWSCLCSFGRKPTYIALARKHTELLAQLKEAANLITQERPAFLGELYEKYFPDNPMRKSLTHEEQAWVNAHPVLHVGCFMNDAPYIFSYDHENKTATGLTVDVINGIIDRLKLGTKADFHGFSSLQEMQKALDSGEIDVIIPFYPNHYIAQQHNLIISHTVRISNMEIVYRDGTPYSDAIAKIATPTTKLGIFYVQEHFPDSSVVGAVSIQDAVDKVLAGEADSAIAQNVVLHNIKSKYPGLDSLILAEGCGTCFAARPQNYALIRILNRGLLYFPTAEISAISAKYTLDAKITTMAYLASHKEAVLMLVVIFITILALISALIKMNRLKKMANDASQSKTAFLFNMSHDIRTPMNAIIGYTNSALRHGNDLEKINSNLRKIKVSGEHLLNLINDILEMSRIESGKLSITVNPLDLCTTIDGISQMGQALAIPRSIDFKTILGKISNPYVMADELHLNEVIINLISNAMKYTPNGGMVEFHAEQLGDVHNGMATYRFTVTDNGIGMSEEFQKHLFENFSREETATVSKQEGAGLGLAIVKKIVDLSGGTIQVHSRRGVGSTFIVEFPFTILDKNAEQALITQKKDNEKPEDYSIFTGKKVLLVEDNEMNREIAVEILEETGMDIDTAEDGAIAVNAVTDKGVDYYDFILMDIQMPVMNGYEATKAIRQLPGGERAKIIALSANAFTEDRQKSLAAGMNAHEAKPINIKSLFETMSSLQR